MKIQSLNLYNINVNNNQHDKFKKQQIKQTYPQITQLSNSFYVPFCGQKENKVTNNVINELLNEKSLDDEKKEYLRFLASIDYFSDAISGLKKEDLHSLVFLCENFSPWSEDVLMGNYVAVCGNVEKPLLDLKAIAIHNKKHPDRPINLIRELFENSLVTRFMIEMKKRNVKTLNGVVRMRYNLDEQKVETFIKYSPKKLSSEKLKKLKNAPMNEDAIELLKFKSFEPEYKQTLWELTEIPYFNAATKNLSLDDLKMLVEITYENKAFITEALKGNVIFFDKKQNMKASFIDLERFVIENETTNPANRVFLTSYLFDNVLFTSLTNEIMKAKYYERKYPSFLYAEQIVNGNEFVPYFSQNKEETKVVFMQCANKYSPINQFILFKNDLNDIDPIRENDEIEQKEETLKEEMILEQRKKYPSPKAVHEYLKNPDIDIENKRIVFNFAEEFPYFNYLMRNAKVNDVELLVKLKNKNPKLFENLLAGKIKIDKKPLLNLENLVLNEGFLNDVIAEKSLILDIFKEISSYEKAFDEKLIKMNYLYEKEIVKLEFYENGVVSKFNIACPKKLISEEIRKIIDKKINKEIEIIIEN